MALADAWIDTCSSVGLACRTGDVQLLQQLLNEGKPADVKDNRGWQPVHEAAFHGHSECLEQVVKTHTHDMNWKTFDGETPLFLACSRGNAKVVRTLLRYGAEPNLSTGDGTTPLHAASKAGCLQCVRLLSKSGVDIEAADWTGWRPLHEAVKNGSLDIVRTLVRKGASVDAVDDDSITPFFTAAQFGQLDILQCLWEKSQAVIHQLAIDGASPLMMAAQGGHLSCVEFLIENGADANLKTRDGATALHLAAQFEHIRCAQVLLDNMSTQTLETLRKEESHSATYSILHTVVDWERRDMLELLLDRGFHPDVIMPIPAFDKDDDNLPFRLAPNFTPLSRAARNGYNYFVTSLEQHGADVDYHAHDSRRPLTCAVLGGSSDVVRTLIQHGCNINYITEYCRGPEALLVAIHKNDLNVLDMLLKAGGRLDRCIETSDHELACTFWSAITEGACKTNNDFEKLLAVFHKYFTLSLCNKVANRLANDIQRRGEITVWHIPDFLGTPLSLQHSARIVVRQMLVDSCQQFQDAVQRLPIPPCLVSYLLYEH